MYWNGKGTEILNNNDVANDSITAADVDNAQEVTSLWSEASHWGLTKHLVSVKDSLALFLDLFFPALLGSLYPFQYRVTPASLGSSSTLRLRPHVLYGRGRRGETERDREIETQRGHREERQTDRQSVQDVTHTPVKSVKYKPVELFLITLTSHSLPTDITLCCRC
jgi:hypothetical protein